MDLYASHSVPSAPAGVPHISVVVPVYKAENTLNLLYERLKTSLELISFDFEIILVEDCGGDRSWEIITELGKQDERVVGIHFSRNFGQHYGITAGLDQCRGDWVVVMDGDLQDRPEEIPRLYAKAQEGYDVVLACRKQRKDPIFKRFNSWLFYKAFNVLSGMDYDGSVGNFRLMSRKVVLSFCEMREHLRFFGGLMNWMGFPSATMEVEHAERYSGKSTYTFKKLVHLAGDTIIAYSERPLWLSVQLGFLFASMSFLYAVIMLVRKLLYGSEVTGWTSLIISIYFVGGVIIANLGVIGIYVGKTLNETKKRPLYIVRSTVNVRHAKESGSLHGISV